MDAIFPALLIFGMVATLVVVVVGVVSFAAHGQFYQRNSNYLMRLRVVLQGLSVAVLAFMVWLVGS